MRRCGVIRMLAQARTSLARSGSRRDVAPPALAFSGTLGGVWSDGSAVVSAAGYQGTTTRVFVTDPR